MSRRQMSSYGQIKICFSLNFRKQWKVKYCVTEKTIWKLFCSVAFMYCLMRTKRGRNQNQLTGIEELCYRQVCFFIYLKETAPQEEYKTGFVIYITIE
jgi:hypothetical protein